MREKQMIEVITYEQDRLNYFTDLMEKAQKRYKQLFKKYKDAPYVSEEAQMLSDAGRETHFLGDVVEMLEKGYRKQIEGEWIDNLYCSVCGYCYDTGEYSNSRNFCPNCGAKMKGGKE